MPLNMSGFDAVLKEFTEGAVRDTLNNEVVAFRVLDETDREWSGRHIRFPVRLSRNRGVNALAPIAA